VLHIYIYIYDATYIYIYDATYIYIYIYIYDISSLKVKLTNECLNNLWEKCGVFGSKTEGLYNDQTVYHI